jgi:hypothetical protein
VASRILSCTAIGLLLAARGLTAQAVDFRVGAVDMFGGAVFAPESDPGVGFGARVGLLDLVNRSLQVTLEFEWWTADRQDVELEVRDIVFGLAFLKKLSETAPLRPYFGLSAALHSIDTSRLGGDRFLEDEPPEAQRISGYRAGASGFAGIGLRLTHTGAIWLLVEYRYTTVSELPHHEVRAGARLQASRP